jgi:hypothetical protein
LVERALAINKAGMRLGFEPSIIKGIEELDGLDATYFMLRAKLVGLRGKITSYHSNLLMRRDLAIDRMIVDVDALVQVQERLMQVRGPSERQLDTAR